MAGLASSSRPVEPRRANGYAYSRGHRTFERCMREGTRAMPTSVKQLMEAANAAVPKISGKEAQEMVAKGALLVDVRDGTEVAATGKAAGAVHVPRGSLEFKAD